MNSENHPTGDISNDTGQEVHPVTRETPFVTWIERHNQPEDMCLPEDIGTYNGRGDPGNHIEHFVKIAMRNRWSMSMACHVFDRTLVVLARIWMDSLLRSILHFVDLENRLTASSKPATSHAELFLATQHQTA